MRKPTSVFLSIAMATSLAVSARAALAESVDQKLARARAAQGSAQQAAALAEAELQQALARYARIQARLAPIARDLVSTYQAQQALTDQLASAQQALDEKVTQAYEYGPGAAIELFLGSTTPADYASAQVYASSAFEVDDDLVGQVARFKADLAGLAAKLQDRQRALAGSMAGLDALAAQAGADLAAARAKARVAGLAVRKLEREQRALEQARADAYASLAALLDPSRGKDQSKLLALLGPTGGKTCTIPDGLVDTGQDVDGESSWYGWDFAGQHTASGAIFDPRLFTLANKELPLGVFLRIHYNGKCAIALVNDRGPYGVEGRLFDVSEAVAQYLGYKGAGVADVTTDVLVPES